MYTSDSQKRQVTVKQLKQIQSWSDGTNSRTLKHMTMVAHVSVRVPGSVEVLVSPLGGVPVVAGGGVLLHGPSRVLELLLRVRHEGGLRVGGWWLVGGLLDRRLLEGHVRLVLGLRQARVGREWPWVRRRRGCDLGGCDVHADLTGAAPLLGDSATTGRRRNL